LSFPDVIEKDGFVVIGNVFSNTEIDQMSEDIAACNARRSKAGIRHAFGFMPIANIARHPRVMELARSVLGMEVFPFRAILFDKSPRSNWLVVWHQDKALPLRERSELHGWGPWSVKEGINYAHAPTQVLSQVLGLRIHLDESTSQNGPLRVLPGSHALGVLHDEKVSELATKMRSAECLVPVGGILAMRPLLIHASSKSRSDAERRVLHIEYAASPSIAASSRLDNLLPCAPLCPLC
jgi:ectoine hydroxylase-related dioxygenase (phytanoyl-CoA dioxygenase family)